MSATQDISYYVINMAKDVARWQQLQAECPSGVNFTRFEGIDGRNLDGDDMSEAAKGAIRDIGKLTPPELGCMLSHIGVWQALVDSAKPLAVVMEDDVMFAEHFVARLQDFLQQLPQDFDIAYLGFNADMHINFEIPGMGRFNLIGDEALYGLATKDTVCYRLYRAWGLCSYVISRQSAARLLDLVTNKNYPEYYAFSLANGLGGVKPYGFPTAPIDMRIMSLMEHLQAYVAFPPICRPRPQVATTIYARMWEH